MQVITWMLLKPTMYVYNQLCMRHTDQGSRRNEKNNYYFWQSHQSYFIQLAAFGLLYNRLGNPSYEYCLYHPLVCTINYAWHKLTMVDETRKIIISDSPISRILFNWQILGYYNIDSVRNLICVVYNNDACTQLSMHDTNWPTSILLGRRRNEKNNYFWQSHQS